MSDISERTIECFTHGLAHLIAELGFERGLAVAGKIVLALVDEPQSLAVSEHAVVAGGGEK